MSAGNATGKVHELVEMGVAQFELYKRHLTPANISLGVTLLLGFAGLAHALPGLPVRVQAKQMGIPGWFIICAGLLMLGSGALYYLQPAVGLYAVSLSMGGAFATAAKMPNVMHRPGGMVFSSLTLAAALWANFAEQGTSSMLVCAACAASFLAGIAGRIFAPTSHILVKMFQSQGAAAETATQGQKTEEAKPEESPPPSESVAEKATRGVASAAAPAAPEVQKMPSKVATPEAQTMPSKVGAKAKAGGARKRVESPAPAAKGKAR